MKLRKINTTRLLLLITGIIACILLLAGAVFLWLSKDKVTFYIDGNEQTEHTITMDYGSEIEFTPQAVKLTAVDDDKQDITAKIKYEIPLFNELKEYEIPYTISNEEDTYTFVLHVKVEDQSGPVFSGPESIDWTVNKEFIADPSEHGIAAQDAYDGDITDIQSSGTVDVAVIESYEVTYTAKDSSGNTSEYVVTVHVKETSQMVSAEEMMYHDPRDITPKIIEPNSMTVLVNKYHAIPDGWAPSDLVPITSNNGRDMQLRSEAARAWEELNQAAQAQGITIYVVSSFRTAAYQASLFNNYYAVDGANAFLYSALSRRSEHELGLAIDVSNDAQLHEDLLETSVGRFMNEQGYKYGFILRYPQGKEGITGYGFEAWHYRYVGTNLATELKQRGIVLEEYYQ